MFGECFRLHVVLTEHARLRMAERAIDEVLLLDVIDAGELMSAGDNHYWLYKYVPNRADNFLCAAAVIDNAVVVKTVRHKWGPPL